MAFSPNVAILPTAVGGHPRYFCLEQLMENGRLERVYEGYPDERIQSARH